MPTPAHSPAHTSHPFHFHFYGGDINTFNLSYTPHPKDIDFTFQAFLREITKVYSRDHARALCKDPDKILLARLALLQATRVVITRYPRVVIDLDYDDLHDVLENKINSLGWLGI